MGSPSRNTEDFYRATCQSILRRAIGATEDFAYTDLAKWLVEQTTMTRGTQQVYRAALRWLFTSHPREETEVALQMLESAPVERWPRQANVDSLEPAKEIPEADFVAIVQHLSRLSQSAAEHADDATAARWLAVSVLTGLRPTEWQTAVLSDWDLGQAHLTVHTAKVNSSRGTPPTRDLQIADYDTWVLISTHLAIVRDAVARRQFPRVHRRCASRLRAACHYLWPNDEARQYSLYSGRHQFSANTRAVLGVPAAQVLLGHAKPSTTRAYGRGATAWSASPAEILAGVARRAAA